MFRLTLAAIAACLVWSNVPAAELRAGDVTEFTVMLSADQRRTIGRGRPARIDRAVCVVGVPAGFDPGRPWPILVVSATSDPGYNSSCTWVRERFAGPALAAGWVVIAADPEVPQPPAIDGPELRYVLAAAALDHLARTWPGFAEWPVAFGGFSGGSKHSVHLAAQFARAGRVAVGLFLGGCNDDVSTVAMNLYSPPRRAFRRIPVFLSGGMADTVAAPAEQARTAGSLRGNGFRQVRHETYSGGHVFHPPHLATALAWFDELRASDRTSR